MYQEGEDDDEDMEEEQEVEGGEEEEEGDDSENAARQVLLRALTPTVRYTLPAAHDHVSPAACGRRALHTRALKLNLRRPAFWF